MKHEGSNHAPYCEKTPVGGGAGAGQGEPLEESQVYPSSLLKGEEVMVGSSVPSVGQPGSQELGLGAGGTGSLKEIYFCPSLAVPQPQTFYDLPKQHLRPGTECSNTHALRAFHTQLSAGA